MKKVILLLGLMLIALQPLSAQDTVKIRDMRLISRYFVPEWPHNFQQYIIDKEKYFRGYLNKYGENLSKAKAEAWYRYTADTLQVYGIAASLSTMWRLNPDYYAPQIAAGTLDTSCEFLYDYLRLYEAEPDSLRPIGEELLVNLRYTPVSYYVDMELLNSRNPPPTFWPVLPIYERYFTTPVTVVDSFYVGRQYRPDHHDGRDVILPWLGDSTTYDMQHWAIFYDYLWTWELFGIYDSLIRGWDYVRGGVDQLIPFIFPIIAPLDTVGDTIVTPGDTIVVPGDTIINGGDTIINPGDTIINPGDTIIIPGGDTSDVSIRGVDMIYRYTSVMPNPATSKVRILSSFGLTRIEAYDLKGRLLLKAPVSGLKTDLDVSSWPRGTYLLRIFTSAGPTTKKLLIQ